MLRLLLLVTLFSNAAAADLQILSWNIESGGADPAIIARQLAELPQADAYLLQEVSGKDIGRLAASVRKAHGATYKYYLSSLGGADRLAILFDESKYRLRSFSELFSFGDYRLNDWRHRSPLVAHLQRKSDGLEFLLVTVHLARGNAALRTEQAIGLREWARSQDIPVVIAGDFNFDYNFVTGKGNNAYTAFFQQGVWQEAITQERIDSNWSDRDGDGQDNYPDSCLDFGAVCPNGKQIRATSRVIVRAGDFPDTKATSDHRPLLMQVEFGSGQ